MPTTKPLGRLHILRHTFCSRLAMRGATAKSIQELAEHQHLSTTQGYMHLSPAARESAIRLLDAPLKRLETGDGRLGRTPAVGIPRGWWRWRTVIEFSSD